MNCSNSCCQRGINYNATGALTLNNVTVLGTALTETTNTNGSKSTTTVAAFAERYVNSIG